jgi:hypothetical protein
MLPRSSVITAWVQHLVGEVLANANDGHREVADEGQAGVGEGALRDLGSRRPENLLGRGIGERLATGVARLTQQREELAPTAIPLTS